MCDWGNSTNVCIDGKTKSIDSCIATFVRGLNTFGFKTIASCCGHGKRPGNIALADGREIIICPDYETARKIDTLFPLDIHGNQKGGEE